MTKACSRVTRPTVLLLALKDKALLPNASVLFIVLVALPASLDPGSIQTLGL